MTKKILLMSLAVLALASCEKKQSNLDLEQIQTKAHIEGVATYEAGYYVTSEGVNVPSNIVAAANKKVTVLIPLSAYYGNSEAVGNKTYETTTAADGSFAFDIPVPSKGLSGVTMRFETFKAEVTESYDVDENYDVVYKKRTCSFGKEITSLSLNAGTNKFLTSTETQYQKESALTDDAYSENVDFVLSKVSIIKQVNYDKKKRTIQYDTLAQAGVLVEVAIIDNSDGASCIYAYKTDNSGSIVASFAIKSLSAGYTVQAVRIVSFAATDKVYDADGYATYYDGAYVWNNESPKYYSSKVTNILAGVEYGLTDDFYMKFNKDYGELN